MLTAVIFDFDGVIVDTEPLHYKAFQQVLTPLGLGYSWEHYVAHYMGFDDRDAFHEVFKAGGRSITVFELDQLIERKSRAFQEGIANGVSAYPGAVELIRSLSGQLPIALCSGALPSDINPILKQLGLAAAFDVIVTAVDVAASKPDPASYLLAVERLSRAFADSSICAENCIAIEDTPGGIASATAAGVAALAVTNSYTADRLKGPILIVDTLCGITLDILQTLV
ncbi:MAG: HAD family phosphatase [Geobacteraceae bacterium]